MSGTLYNPRTGRRMRRGSRAFNQLMVDQMHEPSFMVLSVGVSPHRRRRSHSRSTSRRRRRSSSRRRRPSYVSVPGYEKPLRIGRPSPSLSATSVPEGAIRRGQDGNMWETRVNRAGVQRWVKL